MILSFCSVLASRVSLGGLSKPRCTPVQALVGEKLGDEEVVCATLGDGWALEPESSEFEPWAILLVPRCNGVYYLIFQSLTVMICKMEIVPPHRAARRIKRSLMRVYMLRFPASLTFWEVLRGRRKLVELGVAQGSEHVRN